MLLRIWLISLTAISLTGCFDAPEMPDIKDCDPIFVYQPDHSIDYSASYIFCVLHSDPNNESYYERYPISDFLTGKSDSNYKAKLHKGSDYLRMTAWENEIKQWAAENCKKK